VEDVTEIILNLKQVRLKQKVEDQIEEKTQVVISGQEKFKAGDINNFLSNFQVLNPEHIICHLNTDVKIVLDLKVKQGRGYVPAEENKSIDDTIGTIAIDSVFTPIRNVKYFVEDFRVEQKTDYEKLILDIKTDGSINAKDALEETAKILIQHIMLFSDEKIDLDTGDKSEVEEFDESSLHMRQLLKTKLDDLNLSVRALNCLKVADIDTLGDLVLYNKNDLLKFRNFGRKSLTELEELVKIKNLQFGMDISQYKLDKE
ncbi:MAG: DNA-directed RNA polymerase subunit alpha, partial [Bacteroidetes bacterium HGW-Bacteroidetes-15]